MRACVVLLLLTFVLPSLADSRGLVVSYRDREAADAPIAGDMRLYSNSYALVIGIDEYSGSWPRLSNAINDAKLVSAALEQRGFEVTLKTNLDGRALETAFEDFFIDKGEDPESRLFVWYAGHGHTVDGEGYLIPADGVAETDVRAFKRRSLSLRRFGEFVRLAESKHVYTVFDSCFAGTIFNTVRSVVPPAVTRVTAAPVRQFLTSGDAGQAVSDDGTFARLFVEAIEGKRVIADPNRDGYITASEMGAFLSDSVANYSFNRQVPRFGKLRDANYDRGDFVFLASLTTPKPDLEVPDTDASDFSLDDITRQIDTQKDDREAWDARQQKMAEAYRQVLMIDSDDVDTALKMTAYTRFQQSFAHDNPYSSEDDDLRAKVAIRLAKLEQMEDGRQHVALLSTASGGSLSTSGKACDVCPEMVLIPAGSFRMGDLNGGGESNEKPVRQVDISTFALGKYEVTFLEYDAFAKATNRELPRDRGWGRGTRPVIYVSWEDAKAYAQWLSGTTGLKFRLPSEAEWEYAARAGTTTQYYWGNSPSGLHANGGETSGWPSDGIGSQTGPVGRWLANEFGLHDMSGNVFEWTEDCPGSYRHFRGAPSNGAAWISGKCQSRVMRGGGYPYGPDSLRSASRSFISFSSRQEFFGFRVAQDL